MKNVSSSEAFLHNWSKLKVTLSVSIHLYCISKIIQFSSAVTNANIDRIVTKQFHFYLLNRKNEIGTFAKSKSQWPDKRRQKGMSIWHQSLGTFHWKFKKTFHTRNVTSNLFNNISSCLARNFGLYCWVIDLHVLSKNSTIFSKNILDVFIEDIPIFS